MGWIARAQLASAVSNAGGMGIIETSSGELDAVRDEIRKMRDLTDKPFGVNIAQLFVRDPSIVDFVVAQGVRFVTTSAGDPTKYTKALKAAGLTVYHVVPSLRAALKAIEAGVDGLVVEGGEGGGFKNPRDVATMVLLPLVCSKVDVPVIAAGGIADGRSDGRGLRARRRGRADGHAHGVGRRVAGARELQAGDLRRAGDRHRLHEPLPPPGPARAAHEASRSGSSARRRSSSRCSATCSTSTSSGDMEASIALSGQVAGRIESVQPVARDLPRDAGGVPRGERRSSAKLAG